MTTIARRSLLIACAAAPGLATFSVFAEPAPTDPTLRRVIETGPRSPEARARDVWRHPEQSLLFWGLKPGQTVIEVLPGGGWWTDILAPYLALTGGRYIAAEPDISAPGASDEARKSRQAFETRYADHKLYGDVSLVAFGPASGPLAPPGSVDLVLVSREAHNWVRRPGFMQQALGDIHAALKPGGVLAVEEHRAAAGADPMMGNGYLPEAFVIGEAAKAGFVLAARSEINANPKDTKDYPFGVWTLPPTRRSAPLGQPDDPGFDHSRYDAIGESDRMTLKFVKPA
jgi:predicted methyltransferase